MASLDPLPATNPPSRHGQAAVAGVLYCNLGTPDEPTAAVGAALPRRVPQRPARGGDSAPALVAAAARHHPAAALGQVGRQVRDDLDARRLAAEAVDRQAGQAAPGLAGRARPPREGALRHALRQPVDRLAARCAPGRGRHPHPGAAGLSAVFGDHHRQHRGRGRQPGRRARATCPNCASSTAITTTAATSQALARRIERHWHEHGPRASTWS